MCVSELINSLAKHSVHWLCAQVGQYYSLNGSFEIIISTFSLLVQFWYFAHFLSQNFFMNIIFWLNCIILMVHHFCFVFFILWQKNYNFHQTFQSVILLLRSTLITILLIPLKSFFLCLGYFATRLFLSPSASPCAMMGSPGGAKALFALTKSERAKNNIREHWCLHILHHGSNPTFPSFLF